MNARNLKTFLALFLLAFLLIHGVVHPFGHEKDYCILCVSLHDGVTATWLSIGALLTLALLEQRRRFGPDAPLILPTCFLFSDPRSPPAR